VAVELFSRLQALADTSDARLVVVALGTNGRISGNARTGPVVEEAHRRGIEVLNLLPEVEQIPQESVAVVFKPRGHYGPSMNARIAARIEAHLDSLR
jgi:hypothetical protein